MFTLRSSYYRQLGGFATRPPRAQDHCAEARVVKSRYSRTCTSAISVSLVLPFYPYFHRCRSFPIAERLTRFDNEHRVVKSVVVDIVGDSLTRDLCWFFTSLLRTWSSIGFFLALFMIVFLFVPIIFDVMDSILFTHSQMTTLLLFYISLFVVFCSVLISYGHCDAHQLYFFYFLSCEVTYFRYSTKFINSKSNLN